MRYLKLLSLLLMLSAFGCNNPESLMQKGNLAYRSGDLESAANFYARAQAAEETEEAASFNLGKVLLEQGEPEQALVQLERALALEVTFPLVRVYRARSLVALGRLEEARDDLQRATVIQPDFGYAWLDLAKLQASQGDLAEAVVSATKSKPDPVLFEESSLLLADLKRRQGDLSGAIAELQTLLTTHSYRIQTHLTLGEYLLEAKQFSQAEQRLRRALEMQPRSAEIALQLGKALQGQGDLEQAEAMYQAVIQGAPDHPLAQQASELLKSIQK